MLVYRCEDQTKVGPFNSDKVWNDLRVSIALADHCRSTIDYPPFYGDSAADAIGCESKQDLNYWFPSHLRKLLANVGFKLVVFDVPEEYIREGYKQVAFKRDDKFKVAEIDLDKPPKDWYGEAQ